VRILTSLCCIIWEEGHWHLIYHREGKGKQDGARSFEKRRATPYNRGRYHGLIPHQQEHKV
jgi:hypothetical protein